MTDSELDCGGMSSEDLEEMRLSLQQEKDAILEKMHAIVGEQERRIKRAAVDSMLAKMPPAERNKLLDEMKAK